MNWDDLRVFMAVVRAGQIARAGSLLGMDATTVGRRLQRLERALGRTLFERQRDGHRLTEAGERLAGQVRQMDEASQRIGGEEEGALGPAGLVRVSVSEGFGTGFVARHLADFIGSRPAIAVDLVANNGFLSPSKRETDVAILLAPPRKGPLVTRKLTDYGLRLFAAPGYLDRHPPVRSTADLRDHRLIGYIPDFIYAPELNYLREIAETLEPGLRSSSINAQARLAASGCGIAILPCFIGDDVPGLRRVLPEVRIQRSFWLVTHQDTRDQPRIRAFTDWLAEATAAHRVLLLGA